MLDVDFYMKFNKFVKNYNTNMHSKEFFFEEIEKFRNRNPIIYNIETTNRCNMRCKMCPRTTMMTRSIQDMDPSLFENIVEQIQPHNGKVWNKWKAYCETTYGIKEADCPSENHFFLYVIAKVIQLHGYGDPLLDSNMSHYIRILTDKGFPTYFSCNPANIQLESTYEMMEAGLSYIKYSIESTNDEVYKNIRGNAANFSNSYHDILKVLDYKKKHNLKTVIVITMLNLDRKNQEEEYRSLEEEFRGLEVYLYLKSENGLWYRNDYHPNKSIHWSEPCKHPWMTMTIKSNGEVAMCPEDFNNEIVLGDAKTESLFDIWNGEKYRSFRWKHINVVPSNEIKCIKQCDMKLIGSLL